MATASARSSSSSGSSDSTASTSRESAKGVARGSKPFSRGALYHLLSNPIYVGEIRHKKERHPGQHDALVSREIWARVQLQLRGKTRRRLESSKADAPRSPLSGKLFDESGQPLYVQGAAKGKRRYRYYVSKGLVRGDSDTPEKGWRISAPEIEQTVSAAAIAMLRDESAVTLALETSRMDSDHLSGVLASSQIWVERLQSTSETVSALAELVTRVDLSRDSIRLSLALPLLAIDAAQEKREHLPLTSMFPVEMRRRGVEMRMVLQGDCKPSRFDRPLIKAVARARRWSHELRSGQMPTIDAIARREQIAPRYVRDLLPLACLSPRIVEAIVEGRQPTELTVIGLTRRIDLPLLWSAQELALGLADPARPVPSQSPTESREGTTEIAAG